jgi:FKBP-type peptidyl-prolyl cis-trans isomerase
MPNLLPIALVFAALLPAVATAADAATSAPSMAADAASAADLSTDAQKMSYLVGSSLGTNLRPIAAEVDTAALVQGLKAGLEGKPSPIPQDEAAAVMQRAQTKMRQQQDQERSALAAKERIKGKEFEEANRIRDGVFTSRSGLQYEVLKAAAKTSAPKPKASSTVRVHYRGTLIDGREFDSSYSRNQPATLALTGVIAGWTEGLQQMQVGEKSRLVVPPDIGYGDKGSGAMIGPGATLVFEVELLEIVKP